MGGEEVPKRQEGGTLRGREGNLEVRGGAGQGAGVPRPAWPQGISHNFLGGTRSLYSAPRGRGRPAPDLAGADLMYCSQLQISS